MALHTSLNIFALSSHHAFDIKTYLSPWVSWHLPDKIKHLVRSSGAILSPHPAKVARRWSL